MLLIASLDRLVESGATHEGEGQACIQAETELIRVLRYSIFFLLLLAVSVLAYRRSSRPFDYWMYVAALGDRASASQHIPDQVIEQRMGFYTVKPLFLAACRGAATFLGPERAVNFTAAAFFFPTGVIVWLWSERRTLLTLLLMTSYVVIDGARLGTPDTMQAFLLLLGAWLLMRGKSLYWVPLLLSVWVRADAAIVSSLLVLLDFYRRGAMPWAVLPIAASAAWLELGYRRLVSFTTHGSYLHGLIACMTDPSLTLLFPFVLLGAAVWRFAYKPMIVVAATGYLAHLILFPNADSRYAMVPCLIVGVEAILSISAVRKDGGAARHKEALAC